MGESLTEQYRVCDEDLRVVKHCRRGRTMTVPSKKAPANYVPAAAVIRRGLALSRFTGRKALSVGKMGVGANTAGI